MQVVRLLRVSSGPLGTFGVMHGPWGSRLSVELPWRDNAQDVSCVPLGSYRVAWTWSKHFQRHTYQLLDVPGRGGIRLHTANWPRNLLGCIGPGRKLAKFGDPPTWGVTHSGSTLREIESGLGHLPFTLSIEPLAV